MDKLVNNLPEEVFKYTQVVFQGDELKLMTKKGVYPYDYMHSFDKCTKKLPSKEEFCSILNNEHISDEAYEHAQTVWKTFNLKHMGGYRDLHLRSDVLFLADVFENFRQACMENWIHRIAG